MDRFQRTRGVLRLMAKVIYSLWSRDDRSLLITPSSVPIDDLEVGGAPGHRRAGHQGEAIATFGDALRRTADGRAG